MTTTIDPDAYMALQNRVNVLEQTMKKMKSAMKKEMKNNEDPDKPKRESIFSKQVLVSDALCQFLDRPSKSEASRTEVTQMISKYIKENNLANPENRRQIKCDEKLEKLLGVPEVEWFQLQKYLACHYIKTDKSKVVEEVSPVTKVVPKIGKKTVRK